MNWRDLDVSASGSHHEIAGKAAYGERFDEVLKFHPPGLAPVKRGSQAWHIRADGQPGYERRFERTFGFYEGAAAVQAHDGWHHIRPDGTDLYPARHHWCGNFQQGRSPVRLNNGRYQHILADGSLLGGTTWRYAGDYKDGFCVVQNESGLSSHLDLNGARAHEHWFVDLDVFHKGYARARDEEGWMHVDLRGRPAYANRFAAVEPFYNGQARVERFNGGLEVIDEQGRTLVELRAARSSEFASLSADMVGFWRTHTIATGVQLGVIEALPCTVERLATQCDLKLDAAGRLLRGLAVLRIVECEEETWQLTERGEFLRAEHRLTLADAALEYAGPLGALWEKLPDAMRQESTWSRPETFVEVARDPVRLDQHHRMLTSYARHDYALLTQALPLHGHELIVDAGGGFGALAKNILSAFPSVRVVVLDLPEVVAQAQRRNDNPPGLSWLGADLFQNWSIRADVVILARVLHDWDDPQAQQILTQARNALAKGGRLFVVEMLLSDAGVSGALCDLHLLAATGGRERSLKEYERLFAKAGFRLSEVCRSSGLSTLLCADAA